MLLENFLLLTILRVFCVFIGLFLLLRTRYAKHESKAFEYQLKLYSLVIGCLAIYIGIFLPSNIPFAGKVPFFEYNSERLAAYVCVGSMFGLFHPPLEIRHHAFIPILGLVNRIAFVFSVIILVIGFL